MHRECIWEVKLKNKEDLIMSDNDKKKETLSLVVSDDIIKKAIGNALKVMVEENEEKDKGIIVNFSKESSFIKFIGNQGINTEAIGSGKIQDIFFNLYEECEKSEGENKTSSLEFRFAHAFDETGKVFAICVAKVKPEKVKKNK